MNIKDTPTQEQKAKKLSVDEANQTAPGKPIIEEVGSELAKKKKKLIDETPTYGGKALCE